MKMQTQRADRWLAVLMLLLSLIGIFYWVPNDSGSGLVIAQRGQLRLGDALAPTLAFALLGCASLLLFFQRGDTAPARGDTFKGTWWQHTVHLIQVLAVVGLSFWLMRWSATFVVGAIDSLCQCDLSYRALRATRPWNYIGFVVGGSVLVAGLMAMAQRRLSWRQLGIVLGVVIAMAMFYDLPFEHLLLPPNGDV